MFKLPPVPEWSAIHPIAVHLPIGVLAAVPILLVLAMCFGRRKKGFAGAALALLLVGAGGCVLATATGEATADVAVTTATSDRVLNQHEALAELTRNIFLTLAGVYALVLIVAGGLKERLKPAGWVAVHILFLGGYAVGLLALVNTGHLGGRLVHEYGVRAAIVGEPPAADADSADPG